MVDGTKKQFSLTRAAYKAFRAPKSKFLSINVVPKVVGVNKSNSERIMTRKTKKIDVIELLLSGVPGELTPDQLNIIRAEFSGGAQVSPRQFICLSASYRSALYDRLEELHPEILNSEDDPHSLRMASLVAEKFLRAQLSRDKIRVNEDLFGMLFLDFIGSREFYERRTTYKKNET